MSVLTGNVLAIGLVVSALFLPLHSGIAFILFTLGILVWLATGQLEREKRAVDLDMAVVAVQEKALEIQQGSRPQEYKIGKRIG